jgi:predicted alpha/beta hydrolase family esterase
MKNALILHGTANDSQGNWFPWLKNELEKNGYIVWCPDLPHADHPSIKNYTELILGNKNWHFYKESIIIGHSSGGTAALMLMQGFPRSLRIRACFTVSSSKVKHGDDPIEGLFLEPFDFERIKAHAKRFVIFHSKDDPYVPASDGKYLSQALGGELVLKEHEGHFNLEKGPQYKQFPELLEKILE